MVHHIAVDGWSWDVLLRELDAGYRGEAVDAPALQYTDVARTEAERLGGPRMERLLGYWRERLAGVSPLALPADRPRPAFWEGSGDVVRFELPAELVAEVDRVAREQRATRYMLLLAVYQALLGRYSGRSDIAVCTTLADRGRAEVAGLIGPFVNTIVLRTDLSGEPSFAALLSRVRSGPCGTSRIPRPRSTGWSARWSPSATCPATPSRRPPSPCSTPCPRRPVWTSWTWRWYGPR